MSHSYAAVSFKIRDELEKRILSGEPFSYLLQNVEFYENEFFLSSSVLIPRPETEYLVEIILQENKGPLEKILDVGTGSGVILLSLMNKNLAHSGIGTDISKEALEVAKINAKRLRLADKLEFLETDRLKGVDGHFDIIVSNPPYIKTSKHRQLVHHQVDRFEPHSALYLDDETYDQWFKDFFIQVKEHLNGVFYMEGHELELIKQADCLKNLGFSKVRVKNDFAGLPRFLRAEFRN